MERDLKKDNTNKISKDQTQQRKLREGVGKLSRTWASLGKGEGSGMISRSHLKH